MEKKGLGLNFLMFVFLLVFVLISSISSVNAVLVGAYSFNETSGNSVVDYSGFGNTGMLSSVTRTTSGKYGGALVFNGINSIVTVNDSNSVDLTNGMTLEAWVYPTNMTRGWRTVIAKEMPDQLSYSLYSSSKNGNVPAQQVNSNGEQTLQGISQLPANNWTFLAATYDGANQVLYVNGIMVLNKTQNGSIATSANPLDFGGNNIYGEYFNGMIDEVRIYNNSLNQTQIIQDMNTPVGTVSDTTPPSVSITAPLNTLYTSSPLVTINGTSSDNNAVSYVQIKINNGSWVNATGTTTWTINSNLSLGNNTIQAVAYDNSGNPSAISSVNVNYATPYLSISPNKRYLQYANGTPYFVVGDAAWSLIDQLNYTQADFYLQNRSSMGFNTILVNLIEHYYGTNAPANIYNVSPFTGNAFTTPNDAYFFYADSIIQDAASKGITVFLDPLYFGNQCNLEGWCAEIQNASNSDMYYWGQYVGNRYKNYSNIVWVIGTDMNATQYGIDGKARSFVAGLQSYDNVHLITTHNVGQDVYSAKSFWPNDTWMNLNSIYVYGDISNVAMAAYNYQPTLPYLLLESDYENEGVNAQQLRYESYTVALSGGFGHMFGNCPVWAFNATQNKTLYLTCPTFGWETQMLTQGTYNMLYYGQFFNSINWTQLVPDFSHSVVTSGYGTFGTTNYVATAYIPNSAIVSYFPNQKTISINMSKFQGNYSINWFNPSNGTWIKGAVIAGGNTTTITSPPNTDIVLYINSTSGSVTDTIPPSVSITNPANNSAMTGTINVTASASDNVGVSGVQFMIDGNNLSTLDATSPYTASLNTSAFSNGIHILSAEAFDAAGNMGTALPVSVNVNNTMPDTIAPTYSNAQVNSTSSGQPALFSLLVNDSNALQPNGRYIFSTNNTGTWVNDSAGGTGTVTIDSVNYVNSSSGSNSISWQHTVSGQNTLLLVAISDTGNVSNVTYGGRNLTLIGRTNYYTYAGAELWYLLNPSLGTSNVTLYGNADAKVAGSISFNGVNQTNPIGVPSSKNDYVGAVSLNVASKPGGIVVDSITKEQIETITKGSNQKLNWFGQASKSHQISAASSYQTATSNMTNMSWTGSALSTAMVSVGINPASVSTGGSGNFLSTPQLINVTKTLNSSVGTAVGYQWFLTDNAGNANSTGVFVLNTI